MSFSVSHESLYLNTCPPPNNMHTTNYIAVAHSHTNIPHPSNPLSCNHIQSHSSLSSAVSSSFPPIPSPKNLSKSSASPTVFTFHKYITLLKLPSSPSSCSTVANRTYLSACRNT
mmetsp:Transcript_17497/g.26090  ORF Transcript_17497/g.26090 Transcript_17497/m.26090 type:complete len:115 (-) Transcript_17497:1325-1669(-)